MIMLEPVDSKKFPAASVAVVVGRFQVPRLHEGHKSLIHTAIKNYPQTIVVVGVSPLGSTGNNPLDFNLRWRLITEVFPGVTVLPLLDVPDNQIWSDRLDDLVSAVLRPYQQAVMIGSRDSFLSSYTGRFPKCEINAFSESLSGTSIRENMCEWYTAGHQAFRAGAIWAAGNRYKHTIPTVDVACVRKTRGEPLDYDVLLGRKPYRTQWQFPGGFADTDSPSYEHDALRELREECGINLNVSPINEVEYIGSHCVNDPRYAREQDKIKTLFYLTRYQWGRAEAGDDLAEVQWFCRNALKETQILYQPHVALFQMLDQYLEKHG